MAEVAFYLSTVVTSGYFLLKKRPVDALTLFYASTLLYFSPLIIGIRADFPGAVVPQTYFGAFWVGAWLMFATLYVVVIHDSRLKNQRFPMPSSSDTNSLAHRILVLLVFIALLAFVFDLIENPRSILTGGVQKRDLLDNQSGFYNIWIYAAVLGTASAALARNWWSLALFFTLLLFDLIVNVMRVHVIIASISTLVILLNSVGPLRLVKYWRLALFMLPLILVLVNFKYVIRPAIAGDWGLVAEKMISFDHLIYALSHSEFTNHIEILNRVLYFDYQVDVLSFLSNAITAIPGMGFFADFGTVRYHSGFSPALFPTMRPGVIASSVWAQMFSTGGSFAVFMFGLGLLTMLAFLSSRLSYRTSCAAPSVILVSALIPLLAFYVHRNDVYFLLIMIRRTCLMFIAVYYCAWLVSKIKRRVS